MQKKIFTLNSEFNSKEMLKNVANYEGSNR